MLKKGFNSSVGYFVISHIYCVATILSYWVEYESADSELKEAEVDVDYNDMVSSYPDKSLDETARRYIISTILGDGGRVIKIKRIVSKP
jgi:hypothetical protein